MTPPPTPRDAARAPPPDPAPTTDEARYDDVAVLGWPAFENRAEQPYNALLYTALRALGVRVAEHSTARVLSGRYSILHLHWPDRRIRARGVAAAVARSAALLALLDVAHARGMRVIWTVHNLQAHDGTHRPRLERAYWRALTKRLDGFIALSASGVERVRERFPALRDTPAFVVPHGHLRDVYPDSIGRDEARRALALAHGTRVVAFVGQIRAYKNAPQLVRAFRALDDTSCRLVVAGRAKPAALADELRTLAAGDDRIRIMPDFVPDDRLQHVLRAADLVALPYRDIFNSGAALLALSFDRPVLVPAIGAMPELAQTFGDEWVRTYEGELTADVLAHAITWATHGRRAARPPMNELAWDRVARLTLAAYATVVRASRRRLTA
jgi:beta-1,4-mannosyltransferase